MRSDMHYDVRDRIVSKYLKPDMVRLKRKKLCGLKLQLTA